MDAIKKYMTESHLEAILAECKERNMSFDEYLVVYLLSKHGNAFWDHADNLVMKHSFGFSDETQELDSSIRN
ncbi:MAG: hypothetical protein IJ828_11880 [Treponema sp.]|nr:hypothetical protein [Treponema sp.]